MERLRKTRRLKEETERGGGAAGLPGWDPGAGSKSSGRPGLRPVVERTSAGLSGGDQSGPGARLPEDRIEGAAGRVVGGGAMEHAEGKGQTDRVWKEADPGTQSGWRAVSG
jgi:hypothetical protein